MGVHPIHRGVYYLILAVMSLAGLAYGVFFSEVFFPGTREPWVELTLNILKSAWVVALPYALLNYYALIRFPVFTPPPTRPPLERLTVRLFFRYVTRGQNPILIRENVAAARAILERVLPAGHWAIEVVSDASVGLPDNDEVVRQIVVPADYHLPSGTRYKARALHFALSASRAAREDWIIHLDEETRYDDETVRAIVDFVIREQEALGRAHQATAGPLAAPLVPRIGQGIILYGQGPLVNWMTTLADSIRVGDDYGRFRLQFEHGVAPFGMHGSFIICRNDVEQSIGFDHGFVGSITEDAYFALMAQSRGVRFKFVHAFMYERSPFSLADFVRQRRRWFGGLWLCALAPNIPLAQRLVLMSFMGLWSISWFCIFMVFFNIVYPTGTPLWLGVTGGLSFSYYVLLYVIGYIRSFDWRGAWGMFLWRGLLQIALIPVFSALEGAGVIYGLVAPPKDFYVVQKLVPVYQRPASARPTGLRPALQALRFRLLGIWRRVVWFPTYLHIRALASMRGLDQRDTATGLLTYAYWLYALHIERGGTTSRSRDVVCVNLTVRGLEPVRATHGQAAADQVMQQIGAALMANIRPYDLACRPQPGQIMLALIDCSPEFGAAATQRLAGTLNRQVLSVLNARLDSRLSLGYHTAPIPKGRLTLDALYHIVQLFRETRAVKASSRVVA